MFVRLGLSFVFAVSAANAGLATPMTDEEQAILQQYCAGDFIKFCSGLPPVNGPETQACFQRNMAELSPGCQSAIKAYKQKKG